MVVLLHVRGCGVVVGCLSVLRVWLAALSLEFIECVYVYAV